MDSELLARVASHVSTYLEYAQTRHVAPRSPELSHFETPFPDAALDAEGILAELTQWGAPGSMINTGGRFFGFVNGGILPGALVGSWVASAWDQNSGMAVSSPIGAKLEQVALRWVVEALHLPNECGGGLVTGATMANFSGLLAARHALLERAGWDVERHGLFGAPAIDVVVGDEVHTSVLKALSMAGFGRERVTRIPVDGQGRMKADQLPPLTDRSLVLIQAGNVNSGAFDPAEEICAQAHKAGAWVHVDGAFGLWAAASPRYRWLTKSFDQADSWATDGHKWPNAGYDCGIVIVREPKHLSAAMTARAAYLTTNSDRDPMDFTPELSRRARGIELWSALRTLGREGLAALVERCCGHAQRFAAGFREEGYEVLNDVVINQVMVSFGAPDRTLDVIRRIQADGTCWASSTVWQGRTAMRISVSSWATSEHDVELSLAAILRIAKA